jgi:hypothetical protein
MIIPAACLEARKAIEADPLNLAPAAEAHVRDCVACFETRVAWLAMDDAPPVQVPADYFVHLPERILRKLPARPRNHHALLWALAAGLLAAVGTGGFLLGKANRQPMVEATLSTQPTASASPLPDAPFQEADDVMSEVHKLTPDEAKALLDRLETPDASDSTKP